MKKKKKEKLKLKLMNLCPEYRLKLYLTIMILAVTYKNL